MSAHVLLNLLNELGKRDKMRGLPGILSLFRNKFNKFKNVKAQMLDSIYHMMKSHFYDESEKRVHDSQIARAYENLKLSHRGRTQSIRHQARFQYMLTLIAHLVPVPTTSMHRQYHVVDLLFIVTLIVGVCNCSMFCCTLLYVPSSFAIILMGKRELVALLSLSLWCLVIVMWLFLAVPWVCLQFVIVVFPDHTHLLLFSSFTMMKVTALQLFFSRLTVER